MFNRNFVLCLVMQLWFTIAFNMTVPLIAQYVVTLGETTAMAGFVAGIFSFLALAMRPFSGYAADRLHNKLLLAVGYIASVVAFVGYALFPNVGAIIAFRVIHALGLCLQTTVTTVVAMQFIPPSRIAEGVGYIGVSVMIGLAIAPTIGVMLVEALGYMATFLLSGGLMLATVGLLLPIPIAPPVKRDADEKRRISIRDFVHVSAIPLTVTILAFSACSGVTNAMMVIVGDARGIPMIALFFLISSLGIAAVRPLAGRMVDRRGLNSVMPATFVFEAACMSLLAFAGNLAMVVVAAVLRVFGQGTSQAAVQGQILKDAGLEKRGVANSTIYIGIDIGQGAGAIVGGALADVAGFEATFLFGPAILAVGLITYLYWYRRQRVR